MFGLCVLCQDFRVVLKNSENCIVLWDVWVVLKIELSSPEFTEHDDNIGTMIKTNLSFTIL